MNTKINNEYSSKDLAESALLLIKDQKLLKMNRQGKTVYFVFADKTRCEELSNQFWFSECLVNAKSYYDAILTLKNRIFAK